MVMVHCFSLLLKKEHYNIAIISLSTDLSDRQQTRNLSQPAHIPTFVVSILIYNKDLKNPLNNGKTKTFDCQNF